MLNEVFQSEWFWPVMILAAAGYYGWVFLTYFKGTFDRAFFGIGQRNPATGRIISLPWDELVLGFALHRRLLADPGTHLDPEEKALLEKTPFRELILQVSKR